MIDVIIIGGGVTGCALARDAALRGLTVTLVERDQLGAGTSGRFHGMLQSGARYVTTDSAYAAQCMRERRIIERTAGHVRADTGGLFVQFGDDPAGFPELFEQACRDAEIPCRALSAAQVTAREPALTGVIRGFEVPDAVFRPWEMVLALAEDAVAHGTVLRIGDAVTGMKSSADGWEVEIAAADNTTDRLQAKAVVIAAGPWTAYLAEMAGLSTSLELAKGSMLIIEDRLVTSVVNRCRPPGSFDIVVPFGDTTIFGTTSENVRDPDNTRVEDAENVDLVAHARAMIGDHLDLTQARIQSYAGVRPLAAAAPGDDGAVSRRHMIVTGQDASVLAVFGGSFTTHRAMAEDAIDRVCARLDRAVRCTTADAPLPPAQGEYEWSRGAALQPALLGTVGSQSRWGF